MDNFNLTLDDFNQYIKKYQVFVRGNPRLASDIEAILRWSSYLIASRKSKVVGELLSSGANLLQLCNDILLRQVQPELKLNLSNVATQLRTFLSVIQSLELLAEIYAREHYGHVGKWAIITVIQITKAAIRLVLLLLYDEGLSKSQEITPLDRIHYIEIQRLYNLFNSSHSHNDDTNNQDEESCTIEEIECNESDDKSLILKSSGRKIRSIDRSPPRNSRFFEAKKKKEKLNSEDPVNILQRRKLDLLIARYKQHKSALLTEKQRYGEIMHITKPIIHLSLMGAFGSQSWISYLASLAMDASSLYLIRPSRSTQFASNSRKSRLSLEERYNQSQPYEFNINERFEISQRASSLLLYLLRSPFFDRYTKQKALEGLRSVGERIPIFGTFIITFADYIPEWQQDYFRVWG